MPSFPGRLDAVLDEAAFERLEANRDEPTPPERRKPGPPGTHRLTVNIPDDLFEHLRRRAFDERVAITEIVVDALRRAEQGL